MLYTTHNLNITFINYRSAIEVAREHARAIQEFHALLVGLHCAVTQEKFHQSNFIYQEKNKYELPKTKRKKKKKMSLMDLPIYSC